MSELSEPGGSQNLHPAGWASPRGFTHGVVSAGRHVVLAGQIGWNPQTSAFESDELVPQIRQTLQNVVALLAEAGATPKDLVRLTWYITDRRAYVESQREMGVVYREVMGRNYPPMAVVVVSALIEERAKVEIEATAIVSE